MDGYECSPSGPSKSEGDSKLLKLRTFLTSHVHLIRASLRRKIAIEKDPLIT